MPHNPFEPPMLSVPSVDHAVAHPDVAYPSRHFAQTETLHIAACFNNPCMWETRRRHFNNFRRHMAESRNVVLHVAELAYGERPFEVTSAGHPFDHQFRTRDILWHKENLLNLAIRQFPVGWKYGAIIDGDCMMTRPDWALATIHQLQIYDWVQMYSSYADMAPDHRPLRISPSFAYRFSKGEIGSADHRSGKTRDGYGVGTTGLAWAFRQDAFAAVGGLLDRCPLGCYDDKTEVFTDRGWIFFKDLTAQDRVLSLSPAKIVEWQPVTKLHRYPYVGPMRRFKSQAVDLLVTPNHNMVYEKRNKLYFQRAEEFDRPVTGRSVPKSQTWKGISSRNQLPIDVSIEDWAALIGIWLAEGWTYLSRDKATKSLHYRIGIAQNPGAKYRRIAELLDRLPVKWSKSERGFTGNHKGLFTYLRCMGRRSWEKRIPAEIKSLPANVLDILLDWYILGDGNIDAAKKENHTDSRRMFTTSEKLRDDLLEVIIKTGRWGAYRIRQPRTSVPLKSGRAITARRVGYDIWIHRGRTFHIKSRHVSDVDYDGEVFCCETPYHTLLVRRNAKMIWCGNSADWHMAFGLIGEPDSHPQTSELLKCGARYANYIKTWQNRAARAIQRNVGCVPGHAVHYFHGSKSRRGYGDRWKILRDHDFDPYVDLFPDHQGVYQLTPLKSRMRDDMRRYFDSRNEDDIGLEKSDRPMV